MNRFYKFWTQLAHAACNIIGIHSSLSAFIRRTFDVLMEQVKWALLRLLMCIVLILVLTNVLLSYRLNYEFLCIPKNSLCYTHLLTCVACTLLSKLNRVLKVWNFLNSVSVTVH